MENLITEILDDLFALDKDLRNYENQLRKAIEKLIQSKPDTKFDEAFKARLRDEVMAKVQLLKQEKEIGAQSADATVPVKEQAEERPKEKPSFFGSLLSGFQLSFPYAVVAALAIIIVTSVIFFGTQRGNNGGVNLANLFDKKGETKFEFEPTVKDIAGVDPNSSFVIKTSENLSEKKVKELVSFEPKVEFTVIKRKSAALFIQTAQAEEKASDLGYEYEIKITEPLKENVVYKVTVKDTTVADRQYQWAFQVRAPFGVIETTPANEATFVPKSIFIEILFNREVEKDVEKYFEISPKVEGTFDVKDDKLYFRPKKDLEAETIYTVTLKKGLETKSTNEELEEDYSFSFETKDKDEDDEETPFSLRKLIIEATPDKNPAIEIASEAEPLKVEVYSFKDETEYMDSIKKSRKWDLSWTVFAKDRKLDSFKPSEDRKVLSAEVAPIDTEFSSILELPQPLEAGYYFFVVSNDDHKESGWLQSSNICFS